MTRRRLLERSTKDDHKITDAIYQASYKVEQASDLIEDALEQHSKLVKNDTKFNKGLVIKNYERKIDELDDMVLDIQRLGSLMKSYLTGEPYRAPR